MKNSLLLVLLHPLLLLLVRLRIRRRLLPKLQQQSSK